LKSLQNGCLDRLRLKINISQLISITAALSDQVTVARKGDIRQGSPKGCLWFFRLGFSIFGFESAAPRHSPAIASAAYLATYERGIVPCDALKGAMRAMQLSVE
jgi:hypothetical protein